MVMFVVPTHSFTLLSLPPSEVLILGHSPHLQQGSDDLIAVGQGLPKHLHRVLPDQGGRSWGAAVLKVAETHSWTWWGQRIKKIKKDKSVVSAPTVVTSTTTTTIKQ